MRSLGLLGLLYHQNEALREQLQAIAEAAQLSPGAPAGLGQQDVHLEGLPAVVRPIGRQSMAACAPPKSEVSTTNVAHPHSRSTCPGSYAPHVYTKSSLSPTQSVKPLTFQPKPLQIYKFQNLKFQSPSHTPQTSNPKSVTAKAPSRKPLPGDP